MQPWMLIIPILLISFTPLIIRVRASRRLRHTLEADWSQIAQRWGLAPGKQYWNTTLEYRGAHDGHMTHLIAHRALLSRDVRFWPTWFVIIVEMRSPIRLSPTRSDGYVVSASEGLQTWLRPGMGRALDLLPGKDADELMPGVRFDGDVPKLTEEISAILERWFVPGHGFVSDEGISLAWRPGAALDSAQVARALEDATALARWLRLRS